MKTILIDIDNTLIETTKFQLTEKSRALWDRLRSMPDVEIIGFTSRPAILKPITWLHLKMLGIKLDKLIMDKPRADVYIGNRAVYFDCRYGSVKTTLYQVHKTLKN